MAETCSQAPFPNIGFTLPLPLPLPLPRSCPSLPCPGRLRSPAARPWRCLSPPWRRCLAAASQRPRPSPSPRKRPGTEPREKSPAESPGKGRRERAPGRARPLRPPGPARHPATAAPAIAFISGESPHVAAAPLPQPGQSRAARIYYRCPCPARINYRCNYPANYRFIILQITLFPRGAHPCIHDTRTRAGTRLSNPTLAVR